MCGIAGFCLDREKPTDEDYFDHAKYHLKHRGPDDNGIYKNIENGIGLIHTRLSIQDTSMLGHQPMMSEDGRVVIVYNGEIYNFPELKSELECRGYQFKSQSDTEVLLGLYLQYKSSFNKLCEMLVKLNGIFAFAIWDEQSKTLFVARDALGVKPLYIQDGRNGFYFASEIKALPTIPLNLNAAAVQNYLTYMYCPGNSTPALEISKVGPGEAFWARKGKIIERKQWYTKIKATTYINRKEDAISQVRETLRKSVHRQLISDVPVGAFLSGGLDSSSIVAFAREKSPNIQCFTIEGATRSSEGMIDDLPYAKKVASYLEVPLNVVSINAQRFADDLSSMVRLLDEPLADPAPLNVYYISRLARENGMKVLLSGAGGDDLFTGYRRHYALSLEKFWSWLPLSIRKVLKLSTNLLGNEKPFFRRLGKMFRGADLDSSQRLIEYFRWIDRNDLKKLYTQQFKRELEYVEAEDPLLQYIHNRPASMKPIELMLALEQRFFLTDHNLNYTDKMSMANGVEVRVPFLDLEMVHLADRISTRFKQKGAEGKWVLKKAMEQHLPREAIYRSKSGFGAPLRQWFKSQLYELVQDTLSEEKLSYRKLFDPYAVKNLLKDNYNDKVDASYTILALMSIEFWCQCFIDKKI